MKRKVLVVTDLHAGSKYSVMPDEVYVEGGDTPNQQNKICSNRLQKVLYKEWRKMCDEVGKVDACITLGDNIDGPNYKSRGFELWTPSLHQQVKTAADLLSEIRCPKFGYFGVQGSGYHVSENCSADLGVIDCLGGTFGTDLTLDFLDKRIHCSHVIAPSSSPVSKATAPQAEIMWSVINVDLFGELDLILRGHRHEYIELINSKGHFIAVPGWKTRDAFLAKMGLKAAGNEIGYVVLEIENGKDIKVDSHIVTLKRDVIIKEIDCERLIPSECFERDLE